MNGTTSSSAELSHSSSARAVSGSSTTGTKDGPLDAYTLKQLHERTSVKWTEYPAGVLPLWVAEMDCSPVPAVTEVLMQMMKAGDTGYPGHGAGTVEKARSTAVDYRNLPTYQDAYRTFAQERWGLSLAPEQVAGMPDVMQGVKQAVAMLSLKKLVINTPVYPPFRMYPAEAGAEILEADLTPMGRLDFDQLEALFEQADGFLLCNPHNPTGVAHTRQELTRLFELANAKNVRVIVDEIHAPLTSPQEAATLGSEPYVPALSVPGSERAVVLFSAAKGFNLAGFKAALMIVGTEAVSDLARVPETVFHSSATLSIAAHTAALVYGSEWLDQVRAAIDNRRAQFHEGLARIAPKAKVLPAAATYFAWVDFSEVEREGIPMGADAAKILLEHAKVAFNPGETFGRGGAGHVRVNLATTPEVIEETLSRIAAALGQR